MKNITYILLLFSLSVFGQRPNNFNDSTNFARSVRFAVPPYIIQGAGNGKVLTSDANGRATWQTFSSSGVTQQALNDSIARLDSTINAIPTPLLTLTDDSLNISGGNTIELPYIPLSGTEVGKPVTGDIEVGADDYVSIIKSAGSDGGKELKIGFFDDSGLFLQTKANGYDGNVYISENRIQINSNSPTSVGLTSPTDFTANITDLDYTQKKYVDQRISDTATQIRSEIPNVSNFATITNLADTSALLRGLITTPTLSYGFGVTRDTMVITYNGVRTALRDSSGGGASLSGLTAASSINNIFNTNYKQRWNWNTLAGDTSLVLESNSTAAASNLNTVFGIVRRGANATSTQTVTGQVISVKNTGTSSTNIGLNLDVSGATNNYGLIVANGNVGIGTKTPTVPLDILGNLTNNYPNNIGIHATNSNAGGRTDVFLINNTGTTSGFATLSVFGSSFVVGALQNNTQLGAGNSLYLQSDANTSSGGTKTINFITGGYSNSPTLTITAGNPGNVGIGTTTPVASAKLQISSTTSGFLPPVMTSTQASAISSPAQGLMLFVTDTNGTFTSVGWWGYNGATWEKLNN